MKISLVLPVYKKEDEVLKQIIRIENFFRDRSINYELIVVIDGIVDRSSKIVRQYIKRTHSKRINLIAYKNNQGKGYAIRKGFKISSGDVIGFMDADLDINLRTLEDAIKEIKKKEVQIVFPNKFSHLENQSFTRKFFSNGLKFFYKNILNIKTCIKDIGFGLKLFKKEVINNLQKELRINRFACDAEIAYLVSRDNYSVSVIPGFLNRKRSKSTVTNITEIVRILVDLIRIRFIHSRYNKIYKYILNTSN